MTPPAQPPAQPPVPPAPTPRAAYATWQRVMGLRQRALGDGGELPDPAVLAELAEAERAHAAARTARHARAAHKAAPASRLLGAESTGIEAEVRLGVSHVPTSICHLLEPAQHPLVRCTVRNTGRDPSRVSAVRRLRVSARVEGYSAPAVDTVELKPHAAHTFTLLPTFDPARLRRVTELTRATVLVRVEDLDGRVELDRTFPVWLLARTTAVRHVHDPSTGELLDFTPYFGAFVTPNAPPVTAFLGTVRSRHEEGVLLGYQSGRHVVEAQVAAVYTALQKDAGIRYANSVLTFSPEEGGIRQRIRLPRETLAHRLANCLDGTVLFASLLEAMSLHPALVLVPGHAFLGWETWPDSEEWRYLDTARLGTHDFAAAEQLATAYAAELEPRAAATGDASLFRRWPLAELRAERGIMPME
ncbi:hypothetical protein [Streptomyces sp. ODS28]|uniref:hypothetical protein n=1 Tax=Streptomyces sp. ODS28 TaxID=3136688 RepID=UPI0031E8C724